MMNQKKQPVLVGDTVQKVSEKFVQGEYVVLSGEVFYKIHNYDAMEPFFMSIVSSSNHWMFIASSGGLSAGRVSAELALFPYYTVDRLTENSENTGSKVILLATDRARTSLWEPFSERQRGIYQVERNIYKNVAGTAVIFEECNHSLGLIYRYAWRSSDAFGFVRTSWLQNISDAAYEIELLDGIQNILPANVSTQTQNTFSSLLDAYKRSEVDPENGLGIFALNSTLTDLAEPSESLLATTVLQLGFNQPGYLLSSTQLDRFRAGLGVSTEREVRGQRGAYFVHAEMPLPVGAERSWHMLVEVSQDSAAILSLLAQLQAGQDALIKAVEQDIAVNTSNLENIVANADGLQVSSDQLCATHHFANVMFNVMRGGIFNENYDIHKADFIAFVSVRNHPLLDEQAGFFFGLPDRLNVLELQTRALASKSEDVIRLCYAYLPLSFSRRHGDPSRPWNRFAIDIKKKDGSLKLGYEGNWRDIFQNWEALAFSYPEYIESMISTFLSATSVDGYNPYRITRQGVDWEIPEPGNPWANIGYWSDHQIIYLQKLMEISEKVHPGRLQEFLSRAVFSYANVPYRIKPYADVVKDPYKTIDFDWEKERAIDALVRERGTDGRLVTTPGGQVLHASLTEKLLTLLLAKMVNFVPEGGIWMNTQRPEWNDANNALVGKGLSVVTLGYLRRTIVFCKELFGQSGAGQFVVAREVRDFFTRVARILADHQIALAGAFSDEQRRAMMDALGQAGSDYRCAFYSNGLSGETVSVTAGEVLEFLGSAQRYIEHSLRANKRSDNLYHAYNILRLSEGRAAVGHLYEMLEGQVSILSSGMLSADESLALLESLRNSRLYRADQHSYILYPDRELPGFLEKNCITPDKVSGLGLVAALESAQDRTLITRDVNGFYHFSGHIRNYKDVAHGLEALKKQPRFAQLVETDAAAIEALFESVFKHDEFTGRSGTFFAFEGLGSIYWHMVSKLLLAVQETIVRTPGGPTRAALIEKYTDIRKGLSFNKSPDQYGSFPTDPYSHTPKGQGARQPGMTGSVKEEILTRQAELGYSIQDGCVVFDFLLLDRNELLGKPAVFTYLGIGGQRNTLDLQHGSLAYSICQVPVVLNTTGQAGITVHFSDGSARLVTGYKLDADISAHIFQRDGVVHHLTVGI